LIVSWQFPCLNLLIIARNSILSLSGFLGGGQWN
jgi:hypothetical protein